jgi:hypothetical protein
MISEIPGIQDLFSFKEACVAQKMSWAAKRDTTGVEDKAFWAFWVFWECTSHQSMERAKCFPQTSAR